MDTKQNLRLGWGIGWMIAFLGFPPAGALALALIGYLDSVPEAFIGGAVAGAVIGAAQWLALRQPLLQQPLSISAVWVAATAGGLGIGLALSVALFGTETSLNMLVMRAPITGVALGIAQWLVLRGKLPNALLWIVMETITFPVAWWITAQVIGTSVDQGFVIFGASGALVHQAVMGLTLWALLRTSAQHTRLAVTPRL